MDLNRLGTLINELYLSDQCVFNLKIKYFSSFHQEDVEANAGGLKKAKKEKKYKIGRTFASVMFLVLAVMLYICDIAMGWPFWANDAVKFFGKIIGGALLHATYSGGLI